MMHSPHDEHRLFQRRLSLLSNLQQETIKLERKQRTERMEARGALGLPHCVVGEQRQPTPHHLPMGEISQTTTAMMGAKATIGDHLRDTVGCTLPIGCRGMACGVASRNSGSAASAFASSCSVGHGSTHERGHF